MFAARKSSTVSPSSHQPQPGVEAVEDQVVLDPQHPVGWHRLVVVLDDLDAVFLVARDQVVPDDDRQRRPDVGMEPDLDPVVAVADDHVVFNERVHGAVEVHRVVAVVGEEVSATHPAAAVLVVNRIAVVCEDVVEDVQFAVGQDPVAAICDVKADDVGVRTDRVLDKDNATAVAVEHRLFDEAAVAGCVEVRGQRDRLVLQQEVFLVDARGDEHRVAVRRGIDRLLNRGEIQRDLNRVRRGAGAGLARGVDQTAQGHRHESQCKNCTIAYHEALPPGGCKIAPQRSRPAFDRVRLEVEGGGSWDLPVPSAILPYSRDVDGDYAVSGRRSTCILNGIPPQRSGIPYSGSVGNNSGGLAWCYRVTVRRRPDSRSGPGG